MARDIPPDIYACAGRRVNICMKYTKKQITEAIRYWQDVLRRMDESNPYTPGRINSWMAHGMNPSYEPSAVARREEQQKTQELRRLETEVNQRFDIEGYTIRLQPDRYGRNRYAELVFVSPNAQETRML